MKPYKYETVKAPAILKKLSDRRLVEVWEETSTMENTPLLPMVRGWIMDELEARFPKAFNDWMDAYGEDEELRSYIFH